jgi:DNA-binding SARP family transcriptional activator/tetratricopeptide (TPR) repeat protein
VSDGVLRFFLLGQFEVNLAGQPVSGFEGRQTRTFLKALVAAGRALTRDELVDIVWAAGVDPPPGAERDLKVLASRARRALRDHDHRIIQSTETGYRFSVNGDCWVDAVEMDRLVAEAGGWERAQRPALAEATYAKAIAVYRGPFLLEDQYAEWVAPMRERYRRVYLEALLGLARRQFARRDPAAIGTAERVLAEDPYADTAIQAVMLAHAAAGDPSAALDAFGRFRERLCEELGASPSLDSARLHVAILRDEPLPSWPAWASDTRPELTKTHLSQRTPIGRDAEYSGLLGALEAAAAGSPTVTVLVGEPGIGKTHLLTALVETAIERCWTLNGTGRQREQDLHFELLAEVVRSLSAGPDELRRAAGPYADALGELVPELAPVLDLSTGPAIAEIMRRRILEGFLHLLRTLAESRPVLVAVDDAQWADPSSLDALLFCARRLTSSRILWVLTLRVGEGRPVLDDFRALTGARVLQLGPLTTQDVHKLLPHISPLLADRIAAESGGVPLFALELARVVIDATPTSDLPDTLRQAIGDRITRLPADAQRVLEAGAVLGEAFAVSALAALAEVPVATAVALTEELVARRLLQLARQPTDAYTFVHDLIRRVAYDGLGQARRRYLHARITDLGLGKHPAILARHAYAAGRLDQAARLFGEGGDRALAAHAAKEAEGLYTAALESAQEARLGREAVLDLLDRLGRARLARGEYAAAASAHRSAMAMASSERAAALQAVRLGWLAYYQHEPQRAIDFGREAERCADSEARGEGLLLQAKVAHACGEVEQAAADVARAAHLVGPEAMPEVRALEVAVANHRGRYGEATLRFEAAADALRNAGLLHPLASATAHAAIGLAARGAFGRAITLLDASAEQCEQAGAEHRQARVHNTLGGIYRQLRQLEHADDHYARAAELATRAGFAEALAHAWVGQAERAIDRGDLVGGRRILQEASAIVHDPLVYYAWRIRMRWVLVQGQLALLEGSRQAAVEAAERVIDAAKTTTSPKYRVLGEALRAEALGPGEDGPSHARTSLDLALELDAPMLVITAARTLGRLTNGSESEHATRMADSTLYGVAASLPEDLAGSLLGSGR